MKLVGLAEGHWKHWSKNSPHKTLTCMLTLKAWCAFMGFWCIDDTKMSWCKDTQSHRHRLFFKKKNLTGWCCGVLSVKYHCGVCLNVCLSILSWCSFIDLLQSLHLLSPFSKIGCFYAVNFICWVVSIWIFFVVVLIRISTSDVLMWLSAPPTWVRALSGPDGLSDTGLNH